VPRGEHGSRPASALLLECYGDGAVGSHVPATPADDERTAADDIPEDTSQLPHADEAQLADDVRDLRLSSSVAEGQVPAAGAPRYSDTPLSDDDGSAEDRL
jgi:hypothetical protein